MKPNQHSKALQQINALVRSKSRLALTAMTRSNEVAIQEIISTEKVMGHWMALISVTGEQLHLTLNVQFSIAAARSLVNFSSQSGHQEISNSHSKDFIREFCNVTAGFIKSALGENKVVVGISLPLLCRGFDEFFFEQSAINSDALESWKLSLNDTVIYCSSVIEIISDLNFINLDIALPNSGEVEYL